MSRIIQTIGTLVLTVTTAVIVSYYSWQFVLGIPILKSPLFKSIAAIAITTTIVVSEVILVWLVFNRVNKQQQVHDQEWQRMQVNQRQLPSGYGAVTLPASTSFDTVEDSQQSRRSASRRSVLFGIIVIVLIVTVVLVTVVYQKQIGTTFYLPVYGKPALSDSLRQAGQWHEQDRAFSGGTCQFSGGTFHVRETQAKSAFPCPSISTYSDFAFEVQMSIVQGNCGGIDVRSDTVNGTGYVFSMCQDGTYSLMKDTVPKNSTPLLSSSYSSLIHTGLNQSNLIAIVVQGNGITLYVNDQQIKNVQDESYAEGHIAFLALSEDSITEVTYANATLWTL